MKITNINPIDKSKFLEKPMPKKSENKEIPAAIYEKGQAIKKATYEKPTHKYDKATVDKLKLQSDMAHNKLRSLVESLLKRQGKTWNQVQITDIIKIDQEARLEAEALIGEDGPLGAEAVSNNLVDFAKAISGGDPSKLEELKTAIDKGFKEAEKILGELPEVSKKTYKLTMAKLDKWAEEVNK